MDNKEMMLHEIVCTHGEYRTTKRHHDATDSDQIAADQIKECWRDDHGVLCIKYNNGKWWHYNGFGEWW